MSTDVAATIDRLRATYDTGRTTDLGWRKRQLQGVIDLLKDNEERLSEALSADLGKPPFDSWLTELNLVKDEAAHAIKHLGGWAKKTKHAVPIVVQPAQAWTEPQPLGAVLIIAPWNYPLQLLLAPAVAALAAGNVMVLKPSELAPATSAAIADLVPRYLDPEAVVVVEGGVAETTELLAQPWDHILYTGSTRVGQVVMEAAAKHLTPVTLELGGKSPTIIAADADLKVAAKRVAWAKILNAGQTCIAPDYLLVEKAVSEKFTSMVVDELATFRDKAPATSIVNEQHLDRLEGLLEGHGGEELLPRKTDRDTRVMAPVVVRQPDPASAVMQEEIFGPILPVITVDSIDEAISFIKARPRPLTLYLFTSSDRTERKVLDETHAGSVCINHLVYQAAVTSLPFGGVGPSGMGSYHGKAGFDTFSHTKSVLKRPTRMDPGFVYPPYPARVQKILKLITRW
ncbi:aldehyde dehydrogenase family protein [Aquihabitans sp. McL0605]|uniref:aldehyde dehydrogenase family protein n=1 Tax=Aquihabitans sp. McL0605 TaxID=3415671 RepID=UPI003CF6D687